MTARKGVTPRIAHDLPPGESVGWTVGIFADQMARDLADPRLALTDPTGHLMVIGHLSDLAAWSTDLATQVTMIQVRLEEARQPQQSREVPRDE